MAYTRRNTNKDATWARAWTADAYSDLASIAAIGGTDGPHHGDIAYVTNEDLYYFWLDNGTWGPLYTLNIGNVLVISGINYKFYKQTSDTDSARGTALVNATNAAIAGDVIIIGPGSYNITAAITILDNQIIELRGSTIYNTTNNTDLFQVTSKTGWRLQGTGWLQGKGISVGGVITDQAGIRISGTDSFPANWEINGLAFKDFKGAGIAVMSATSGASGGKVLSVLVTNSTYGLYDVIGAEHLQVVLSEFYGNTTGMYIAGGNFNGDAINCNSNGTGVYLDTGANNGHGQFVNSEFLHNTTYTLYANSVTIGFDFVGCHFYPETAAPIFIHECKGIQILGGAFFSATPTITMDGTFAGYNRVQNVWYEGGELTVNGTALQKSFLLRTGNFTGSGSTSATNTAILADGGLTVSGGTAAAGTVNKSATDGLVIAGITGSSNDFTVTDPTSTTKIIRIPTGTSDISLAGALVVSSVSNNAIGTSPSTNVSLTVGGSLVASGVNAIGFDYKGNYKPGAAGGTVIGMYFHPTLQTFTSGVQVSMTGARFDAPTITVNGTATITLAATLYVTGAPTAGVNNYAIRVDGGLCSFQGRTELGNALNLKNYTVATLPAGTRGDIAYVTDATAPTFLTAVVGGGAVVTPVFYDGTNWVAF